MYCILYYFTHDNMYYSVPQLFVHLVFFVWIKGCVKFQAMVQVYKKAKFYAELNVCIADF